MAFAGWPTLKLPGEGAHGGKKGSGGSSSQYYSYQKEFQVEELHPGLLVIEDVFTLEECRAMARAVEATGQLVSTNPRNLPPKKGHAFRNNERFLVRDEAFAERLYTYLKPTLSTIARVEDGATPCGLNPDFRFYRYLKGHSFGPHIDEPVESSDRAAESEFTLLVYLTGVDDPEPLDPGQGKLKGGATRFHLSKKQPIDFEPKTGTVLLHWVLHDCLHEGLLVTSGVKWLLRTDVFFPKRGRYHGGGGAVPVGGGPKPQQEGAGAGKGGGGGGGKGGKKKR